MVTCITGRLFKRMSNLDRSQHSIFLKLRTPDHRDHPAVQNIEQDWHRERAYARFEIAILVRGRQDDRLTPEVSHDLDIGYCRHR